MSIVVYPKLSIKTRNQNCLTSSVQSRSAAHVDLWRHGTGQASHAGSFVEVRVGSCCSYCGILAHEVTLRALFCILGSCFRTLTCVGTVCLLQFNRRRDESGHRLIRLVLDRGMLGGQRVINAFCSSHLYLCKVYFCFSKLWTQQHTYSSHVVNFLPQTTFCSLNTNCK